MALPITTKQIDGGMLLDPDVSTQRSSTGAFYSADKTSVKGGAFAIKRGRSQQMNTAPVQSAMQHGAYGEKVRRGGPALSASRRNPLPPSHPMAAQRRSKNMMFPPLNETSFSEQYKTFKALGGQKRLPMANLEMSKDLQMRIMPLAQNKPYFKRNIRGPNVDHSMNMMMPAGMGMPGVDQSVFQASASHVLSSPGTYNMMADASTAPYPYDASIMRAAMSPHGK